MAAAWPNFVPRIELDVHLKSIDERLSAMAQRIKSQDEHHVKANDGVEALRNLCKELAFKTEVSHLGSRLDMQLACTESSIAEGLQELREYSDLEVQRMRDEIQPQLDALRNDICESKKDIVRIDEAVVKEHDLCEATYATKDQLASLRTTLTRSSDHGHQQLRAAIDSVQLEKASRAQLEDVKGVLRSADEALAKDLATTSASLAQTSQSLVFFDKLSRSSFATKTAVSEVSGSVADLEQRITHMSAERSDFHNVLDSERERLQENVKSVQECWRIVHETLDDIHQLKADRHLLVERCDKSENAMKSLCELENNRWEECQKALAVERDAKLTLQETCKRLCQDMHAHIEAVRQENERLRQHSTIRYLHQLDKALALQQTVDQVHKGHQELHESMRSIKLPKV
jgi:hypothetical protein